MPLSETSAGPIAIDGPAASGKTTVGVAIAKELGYRFLDTGLMYRAFTYAALREGVSAEDPVACAALVSRLDMGVEAGTEATRILIGGEDVTPRLRDAEVDAAVSAYSAIPAVREAMVGRQRAFAKDGRAVLAGRDIGTVVLLDAPVKLYLTASAEERARRRGLQSSEWGAEVAAETSRGQIERRDAVDSTRAASPLRPADDAITIDTSDLALDEVVERALAIAREASGGRPATAHDDGYARREMPKLPGTNRWATPAFYFGGNYLMSFLLNVLTRWKVIGREKIPADGPLIVSSNHLNNLDPPILACVLRNTHHVRFMAKVELFRGRLGWLAPLWGAFALRRFEADLGAVLTAERILRAGGAIGMFPEGTRSRTRTMAPLHPGSASLALRTGATLLPCGITGTEKVRNAKFLVQRVPITVRVGEPIRVERVRRPTPEQVSELTGRLDVAIRALLPPSYGGTYTGS